MNSYRVTAAYVTAKIKQQAAAGVVVTGFYKDGVIPGDLIDPEDRDRLLEKGMIEEVDAKGAAVETKPEPEPKSEATPETSAKPTAPGPKPKGSEPGGGGH